MLTREVFFRIPWGMQVAMYFVMCVSLAFFFYGLLRHFRTWNVGKDYSNGRGSFGFRFRLLIKYAFAQSRLRGLGALLHFGIFWGFTGLFIGTVLLFIDHTILHALNYSLLEDRFYFLFSFLMDFCGLLLGGGLLIALLRRLFIRPENLSKGPADILMILLILFIVISGYSVEAIRIAELGKPKWEMYSPVGYFLSSLFAREQGLVTAQLYHMAWITHIGFSFLLIAIIPFTKLIHAVVAPLAIFFSKTPELGNLISQFNLNKNSELEIIERNLPLGINHISQLTRSQLLSFDACTQCGICESLCPAYHTQKPLSPKEIVWKIGLFMQNQNGRRSLPNLFNMDELSSCTTCGACVRNCPVLINHLDVIVELRRNLVFEGVFDEGHQLVLQRVYDQGNAYGMSGISRDNMLSTLHIAKASQEQRYDFLYWLGCSGYFDDRSHDIVRAVLEIACKLGVKVGVLGSEENCCGDFVRRIGDEGLFQQLALENIRTIQNYKFDKLLVHCPHGYNTFKNEYPSFGADFPVVHHSMFLHNVLEEGKLTVEKKLTEALYHDPCYLGRQNRQFDEPRKVLDRLIEKREEFPLCREMSFCCGAGGGHMWKHEESGKRIQEERLEQALSKGVTNLVTACPFCLAMLEEAVLIRELSAEIYVKDIAEIFRDSVISYEA